LTLVFLALASAPPAQASIAIYQQTLKSTGLVQTPMRDGRFMTGTCWVVDRERKLVMTNKHVVLDSQTTKVLFPRYRDGKVLTRVADYRGASPIPGRVVAVDSLRDLALVQLSHLPSDIQALTLAPGTPSAGQAVYSLGNSSFVSAASPENATLWRFRQGKVVRTSFLIGHDSKGERRYEVRLIDSDSGSKPGDSGGPLVDDRGRLLGVVTLESGSVGRSVDVEEVREFLRKFNNPVNPMTAPRTIEGNWTVLVKAKGRTVAYSLALRSGGRCVFEGAQRHEGTYKYQDGKLTVEIPGLKMRYTAPVTWVKWTSLTFRLPNEEVIFYRR
jgi:S1-C subfamily serine protease